MIVLEGGRLLDPASGTDGVRCVVLDRGVVTHVGPVRPAELPADATIVDCRGRWIVPGLVDLHVHLREPGQEYKETIASGAAAAVAGGFTAVVAMANTKPPIDNAHLVRFVAEKAREADLCRVYPSGTVSKGMEGKELAELGDMRDAGARLFTDDGLPILDAGLMRRALEYAKTFDAPIMVHEEELSLCRGGVMNEGPVSTRLGLRGHPSIAEEVMVLRDLALAEYTGGRVHFGHVSVKGAVEAIRRGKERGLRVTAEATPHHFTLTDEAVAGYDTFAKMCPPLRSHADREAVRAGLADGTIDAIATDHAPHSPVEKDVEFDAAANGVIGLETALPLSLALVREGVLTPLQLVARLSTGPCRALSLPGGRIAVGEVADVTVIDPERAWTAGAWKSKQRNSPFNGWALQGLATHVYVGGRLVHAAKEAR